jgi:hypothetical protein
MSPYFLTIFVLIVELTRGERSSKWRKRNKPIQKGWGFDPTLSMRNYERLDSERRFR